MNSFKDWLKIREEVANKPGARNLLPWFGNSKVVDKNGNPQKVFHGSHHSFTQFNPSAQKAKTLFGPGFYFTEDPNEAGEYAMTTFNPLTGKKAPGSPQVYPVYLSIKNPFYADSFLKRLNWQNIKNPGSLFGYDFLSDVSGGNQQATEKLKAMGYDGIKVGKWWIAFYPNQVKSVFSRAYNPQSDELGENTK